MLQPGHVLQNRYTIRNHLGRGGMGSVYRASDRRLSLDVAIKELLAPAGLLPEELRQMQEQFRQEATVLARLNHPGLVSVTDFFEEGGNDYLVMSLIEGENLADRVARAGPISEDEAVAVGAQLLEALAYCHQRQVLHRDIKPNNIILRPDGSTTGAPVLVDFGLVKLWNPANPTTRTLMRGMGSPHFASPEQYGFEAGHTDARSDIYSVGATLYYVLTAQTPPAATDRLIRPEMMKPLAQLAHRLSPAVSEAITQALAMKPEHRFTSAEAMRGALLGVAVPPSRSAAGVAPVVSPTARITTTAPPPARRGLPVWAFVLIGLLLVAAGASAWILTRGGGTTPTQPEQTPMPAGMTGEPVATTETTPASEASAGPPTAAPTKTLSPTPTTAAPTAAPTIAPTAPPVVLPAGGDVTASPISAPNIDGDLGEWAGRAAYDSPFLVYSDSGWDGTHDGQVLWRLGWDQTNLYIAAQITDNIHVQTQTGNSIFRGDSLEIQIDADRDGDFAGIISPDEFQVNLSPGDFVSLPPSANLSQGTDGGRMSDAPGGHRIAVAARRTLEGYTLEAAVPWSDLFIAPQPGRRMSIALNLDDNDRAGQAVQEAMYSNAPNRLFLDPSTWLPFTLTQ